MAGLEQRSHIKGNFNVAITLELLDELQETDPSCRPQSAIAR